MTVYPHVRLARKLPLFETSKVDIPRVVLALEKAGLVEFDMSSGMLLVPRTRFYRRVVNLLFVAGVAIPGE